MRAQLRAGGRVDGADDRSQLLGRDDADQTERLGAGAVPDPERLPAAGVVVLNAIPASRILFSDADQPGVGAGLVIACGCTAPRLTLGRANRMIARWPGS